MPKSMALGRRAFYNAEPMTGSDPTPPTPPERPSEATYSEPRPSLRERMRRWAPLVLIAFVGGGLWFFSGRVPKSVGLRFVLPPTLRADDVSFPRELTDGLGGALDDDDGQRVATFDVPLPRGLEGPLAPPVGMELRPGSYRATITVRSRTGARARLVGHFEVEGAGEIRVDLAR